jgi:hypothetical protein
MATLIVQKPQCDRLSDVTDRLSALIHPPSAEPWALYFDVPKGTTVALTGEPFLTALLPICMLNGFDLKSEVSVRPGYLRSSNRVQDILHCWYPELQKITVSAPERQPNAIGTGTGVFFSGGVDSFYSLQKHLPRVSNLVIINGFDIAHWNEKMWPQVELTLRQAAGDLGKPILPVKTNIRAIADSKALTWGGKAFEEFWLRVYHGAALAAVGYVLAPHLGSIIVPSTHTYANLAPFGSHPLLDECWSTPSFQVEHDGSEATRYQKIGSIKDFPVALKYLRVCWRNWDDKYNCGRCEKCLRTILILRLHGALDRAITLPAFDPRVYALAEFPRYTLYYYEELLARAKVAGDSAAVTACELILGKRIRWQLLSYKVKRKLNRLLHRRGYKSPAAPVPPGKLIVHKP